MAGVLDAMDYIRKRGEEGRARGKANRLTDLAGQAYGAQGAQRQSLIGQMVGTDPEAGMAFGGQMQKQQDEQQEDAHERAVRLSKMMVGSPGMAPQIYPQWKQALADSGVDAAMPDVYEEGALSVAKSLSEMGTGGMRGGLPSDIRSLQMLQNNPELMQLDRDRRQAGGMVPKLIETAGGYSWGVPGQSLNPAMEGGQSGAQPMGGGQGGAAPQGGDQFAFLSGIPGTVITSGLRTKAQNDKVDGVDNSYHLTDQARDLELPKTQQQADMIRQGAAANGLEVIVESDHWHLEPRGQAGQQPPHGSQGVANRAMPYVSPKSVNDDRRADASEQRDDERLDIQQEAAADLRNDRRIKQEADAAAVKLRLTSTIKQADYLIMAVDTLTKSEGFSELGTVVGDLKMKTPLKRFPVKDSRAQLTTIANQIATTTMSELRQLSSSGATGFGALTAPELLLLMHSIANLQVENISHPELVRSLAVIKEKMQKISAWRPENEQDAGQQTSGGQSATEDESPDDVDDLLTKYGG